MAQSGLRKTGRASDFSKMSENVSSRLILTAFPNLPNKSRIRSLEPVSCGDSCPTEDSDKSVTAGWVRTFPPQLDRPPQSPQSYGAGLPIGSDLPR